MKKGRHILTDLVRGGILGDVHTFYHNTLVRFSLLTSGILQIIGAVLLAIFVRSQQSIVILHYNVYFGVDLIGEWGQVFMIPAIVLVFVIINTLLAQWFYGQQERIASYVLLLTSILISLGSVFACASIAFINY
ncbi:MAG: hypothetical protein PHT88_02385 [Candidatus Moranbacteria bacterium]|nr:hypothetical protein [Candidatus Moranbacteria bacterium]